MTIQPQTAASHLGSQLRWSLHYRGFWMTFLSCLANAFRFTGADWYWRFKERQFDRRHGIDTQGMIPVEQLDLSPTEKAAGWGYMPTQPEWFHMTLERLGIDHSEYTFVDFGSGKGRSLILASSWPFREVIGVEFSPSLHTAALENLAAWKHAHPGAPPARSVRADAKEFQLPLVPLVLYFFNPFKADVMREVVANLENSYRKQRRSIIVVYARPTCPQLLDECAVLHPLFDSNTDPAVAVYATRL